MSNPFKRDRVKNNWLFFYLLFSTALCIVSCERVESTFAFTALNPKHSGLYFQNEVINTDSLNFLDYIDFYNGSGVGAGDFNNDGFVDLYFGANMNGDHVYLNQGGLSFRDISDVALPENNSWTNGISVVDINNDGWLDIYVCKLGYFRGTVRAKNQLLINLGVNDQGIPVFKDEAARYGLAFSGYSNQALFSDFDGDGDLDLFLLNFNAYQRHSYNYRASHTDLFDPYSGDKLFQNQDGKFQEVTRQSGILGSPAGLGLGVAMEDFNMDGYPDLYVCNDFSENDYLYINQQDGTFREALQEYITHTSRSSMGVDAQDFNNDGLADIISVDMLPEDPVILKSSFTESNLETFNNRRQLGYALQYSRNALQLNRNGSFSEVGCLTNVFATDWSWAPLWMDFDNDGWKDLFVSNGIPKRYNDMDFVKFSYNHHAANLEKRDADYFEKLMNTMIEIKLKNKFYANSGQAYAFDGLGDAIENNPGTYSNGAAYADFDNDGDLDIVVNNINESPIIYRNNYVENTGRRNSIQLDLKGDKDNINGIGARVLVYAQGELRSYYKSPVRGFLSSMESPVLIGTDGAKIDSIHIIWPDRRWQKIPIEPAQYRYTVEYTPQLPVFDHTAFHVKRHGYFFDDITKTSGLEYKHEENNFNELYREPLLIHSIDAQGPALAVADINHDGLEDVFVGSSTRRYPAVFVQRRDGKFHQVPQPALEADSLNEETDAEWADVNGDGHPDLIVSSGGNEFYGTNIHKTPKVFLNDGKGNLTPWADAFQDFSTTSSVIRKHPHRPWVFVGGRCVAGQYGEIPDSYLMEISSTPSQPWMDITERISGKLRQAGMVTDALWYDVNSDGEEDLILTLEWGEVVAFVYQNGKLRKQNLTHEKGWWNSITALPPNEQREKRFLVGNYGLNNRLKHADKQHPVKLYYNDFDGNGKKEPVITYFLQGKEVLLHSKEELDRRIPALKKRFLFARDFAEASISQVLGESKLKNAVLEADYFANAILQQKGSSMEFELIPLPAEAQFSTIKAAVVLNNDPDSLDVLCMGNDFAFHQELGQANALFGVVLRIGRTHVDIVNSNLKEKGQVRNIETIRLGDRNALVLAKNSDSLVVLIANQNFDSTELIK